MSITFNYLYFLYLTLYNIAFSVSFRWHFSSSHALLLINEARHIKRIERKKLCTYIFVLMPLTTGEINDHVLVINWPFVFSVWVSFVNCMKQIIFKTQTHLFHYDILCNTAFHAVLIGSFLSACFLLHIFSFHTPVLIKKARHVGRTERKKNMHICFNTHDLDNWLDQPFRHTSQLAIVFSVFSELCRVYK